MKNYLHNPFSKGTKDPNAVGTGYGLMTITFDHVNPNLSEDKDRRQSLAGLDYSPLRRITGRMLALGALVSMGGLM